MLRHFNTLTGSAPGHTIATIGLPSLLKGLLNGDPFPRGTFCAFVGIALISLYYRNAWRQLGKAVEPPSETVRLESPDGPPWPELRYLQIGAALSVAAFVLSRAAVLWKERLTQLPVTHLGLSGAITAALL